MSRLDELLGFDSKKNGASNKNMNKALNIASGAGNTKSNYDKAYDIVQIQKGVQQAIAGFSPQARIVGVLAVSLVVGLPIYTFIKDPRVQMGLMAFFSILILLFARGLMETPQLRWGMMLGWAVGTGIWFYVFYEKYRKKRREDNVGKAAYICNPFGVCENDGWRGVLNGLNKYYYIDPKTKIKTPFIPGNKLMNKIPSNFTYSFWLRVSYNDWSSDRFKSTPNPVLLKGGTTESATPSIWLDEKTNVIQFQGSPKNAPSPIVITLNYPFDLWVHYAIVVYQDSMEVYKNGLLEKTMVLPHSIIANKSNLYIGTTPESAMSFNEGEMPAEMVYLLYYNKSFTPTEIEKLYNDQLLQMRRIPPPSKNLSESEEADCKECPQDCTLKTKGTTPAPKQQASRNTVDKVLRSLGVSGEEKESDKRGRMIDTTRFQNKLMSVSNFLQGGDQSRGSESFTNQYGDDRECIPDEGEQEYLTKTVEPFGLMDSLLTSV